MRRYFEDLRAILESHGGTVEKFVGDAVMAIFGIPAAHEDDALRAVRAASEMRTAIAEHGLEARIGLNTGEVVVGGEGETLVTGDAVNVAARLEQAAGSGEILVGAETRLLVRDAVRVDAVEPLELKGKSEPVEAFRLLDVLADADAVARRLETPLVGRERERQRLWRDYEDVVADSTCRLFTLLGSAGIGKSRLVADFLERVAGSADVLRGRCLSYGEGITYWPLVEMLVPLGIEPEDVVASTPEETRVAFRRLLEARAVDRPQVVVIDDLQWAEPVLVDLVEHVADLSRDAPIFLLCVARTELLDARPQWGGGKLNATSLLLEPLDVDECARLMQQLVPGAELDPELRERITAASAGNPLFVEEMLAMVREHGAGEVTVPPTIHALLQARIDSLDDGVRIVLERAAIEGEVFHRGAVAGLVSDELRAQLETHLTSLIRAELIRPDRSLVPGEDAYRFRHVLIREAAYGAMPKELRAQLHEGFAGWLERTSGESAFELDEVLGYHLEQAYRLRSELGTGDRELAGRAAARLLDAGRGASARADLHAAAGLLERGIELLPDGDPNRLAALPDLGDVLLRRGELDRAAETLRTALEAAREARDEAIEARARLSLIFVRMRIDPEVKVHEDLEECLEIAASLERMGDLSTLARARNEIGMCRFMLGHARAGEADMRRAADIARRAGDERAERQALVTRLRPIAWGPTPASEGMAFCTSVLESEIANVADRANALQVRSLFAAMQGDADGARRSIADARSIIDEYGLILLGGIHAADAGYALLVVGDLDQAESVLRRGHDLLTGIGDTSVRTTVGGIFSEVLFMRGRVDDAARLAEESRAIAGVDDLDAQPRWRATMARVLAIRGEFAAAEAVAREAVALVEPTDFLPLQATVFDALGEVLVRAGRIDEAVAAVEAAVGFHEQKGNVVSAARSRAVLDDLRAARPS
jgi:tetratricopeptide (TPR) repeat protein